MKNKLFVITLIGLLVFAFGSASAFEYGRYFLVSDSTSVDTFKVLKDADADTSTVKFCASYSGMSGQLKAWGVTEADSNGVSVCFYFSNAANPQDWEFTLIDSLSATFGDTNAVMKEIDMPPAMWYKAIVRPTADNKIDETGGGTYAKVEIFWIRNMPQK